MKNILNKILFRLSKITFFRTKVFCVAMTVFISAMLLFVVSVKALIGGASAEPSETDLLNRSFESYEFEPENLTDDFDFNMMPMDDETDNIAENMPENYGGDSENPPGSPDFNVTRTDSENSDDSDNGGFGNDFNDTDNAAPQNPDSSTKNGGPGVLRWVSAHSTALLAILAILDALCVFRLIILAKRRKKLREEEKAQLKEKALAGEIVNKSFAPAKSGGSKSRAVIIALPLIGLLLLALVVKNISSGTSFDSDQTSASTYTGTAQLTSLSDTLSGAGTLAEDDPEKAELIDGVEISKWYVSNGDEVQKGDKLAAVDRSTVLYAAISLQTKLKSLDSELEEAEEEKINEEITAPADGRVMAVYAKSGEEVTDTMYESGSLMLISLDGYLAVSLETDEELSAGDEVTVVLSDGSEISGKVASRINKTATVLIDDGKASFEENVSVKTTGGTSLGSGNLYIHSCLAVTNYGGTVKEIKTKVGNSVEAGDVLLTLTDTDYYGTYETLLEARTKITDAIKELFVLYQDPYIYASCDGIVSGIEDEDSSDSKTEDSEPEESGEDGNTGTGLSYESAGSAELFSGNSGVNTAASAVVLNETKSLKVNSNDMVGDGMLLEATSKTTDSDEETSEDKDSDDGVSNDENSGNEDSENKDSQNGDSNDDNTEDDGNEDQDDDDSKDTPSSTHSYTNYIGVVESADTDDSRNTTTLVLKLLPESQKITDYGSIKSADFDASEMTRIETAEVSNSLVIFTYGGSNLTVGSPKELSSGDFVVITYDSSEPVWIVRIVETKNPDENGAASEEPKNDTEGENEKVNDTSGSGFENLPTEGTGTQEELFDSAFGQASLDETDLSSLFGDSADLSGEYEVSSDMADIYGITDTAAASAAASSAAQEETASEYGVSRGTAAQVTPQNSMTIEITVDELDILSLKVGQSALVTLDAFPGRSFDGEVTSINTAGTNSGGSTKFTAKVTIDKEEDMLAGMNASAKITISKTDNLLCIPENALVEENGLVYVYTEYDEETGVLSGLTEVKTGLSDGENVQITSGLEEGDTYCYSCLDTVNLDTASAGGGLTFKPIWADAP